MAELDAETLDRVARWCAEAGRQAGAAEVQAALAPLSWDELLTVRALLADPPPARPLGPQALADLARGVPADVAAEREREGRYRPEEALDPTPPAPFAAPPGAGRAPSRARKSRKPAALVIRRARDRVAAAPPAPPALPTLDALREPEGRAVLERLVRRHGGSRAALVAALAGWRRPDGEPPGDADLTALLDHHGLLHAFEHRERDEILHALRAEGGVYAAAAARLGSNPEALRAALVRLGAAPLAERIREDWRAELRSRATLAERARLAADPARLADLGLLEELEADLKARLPDHLKALRGAPGSLRVALARSLSLEVDVAAALAERLGLALGEERGPRRGEGRPERRRDVRPPRAGPRGAPSGVATARPAPTPGRERADRPPPRQARPGRPGASMRSGRQDRPASSGRGRPPAPTGPSRGPARGPARSGSPRPPSPRARPGTGPRGPRRGGGR